MEQECEPEPRFTVAVVVPTLNASRYLQELVRALLDQKPYPPEEILLVDSGSTDDTLIMASAFDEKVRILSILPFSHGGARNLGARSSACDIVAYLSQDALPANNRWLHGLLEPLSHNDVAASFSRQVPRPDASPMETFFLSTHFPDGPARTMTLRGGLTPVFEENVFFSNVSAAIRRTVLMTHPFNERLIMGEDQQFALDCMQAGYSVVYAPSSIVIHSHHYTFKDSIGRYFDSVYALRQIFPGHNLIVNAAKGSGYLKRECQHMLRHHPGMIFSYALHVIAKTLGTALGHIGHHLPERMARKFSLHKKWWNK